MKILSQHDLFIVDVQYTEEVMINMIGCIYEGGASMSAHLMTGEVMLAVYKCSSADFTRVPTMHALTPHHL